MAELTQLQTQTLSLFQAGKYLDLIRLLEMQPQVFPDKQVLGMPYGDKPGTFSYRIGQTQWGVKESNNWDSGSHWVVFSVGLDTLTLNLHGCISQSVNWVNATGKHLWVHQVEVSQTEADRIVESAFAVAA